MEGQCKGIECTLVFLAWHVVICYQIITIFCTNTMGNATGSIPNVRDREKGRLRPENRTRFVGVAP